MDIWLLNKKLEAVSLIDGFESFIWTDRFWEAGDFELYLSAQTDITRLAKKDYFIMTPDSNHLMMVEKFVVDTDEELGTHLTISGHSLEYVLKRRLIWGSKKFNETNLQNAVKQLITESCINPSDTKRKIPRLIFEDSTDTKITELKLTAEYNCANLYDTVSAICKDNNIGFRILYDRMNEQFVFSLYTGVDRTYEQTENPFVIFSPKFDNILNSNYVETDEDYYNVALVEGYGDPGERALLGVGITVEGMERREMHVAATDISFFNDDGSRKSDKVYKEQLKKRGEEELAETKKTKLFTGEIDASQQFIYKRDFFMGDILQLENEYGYEGKSRMIELTICQDVNGVRVYPSFVNLDEEGEPIS